MQNSETVTIITACYNQSHLTRTFLETLLWSEQLNSHKYERIIVHNNGSTDDSESVVLEFARRDPRIILVNSSYPLGYARAFNFALQFAETEFVVLANNDLSFPHQDCWLDRLFQGFGKYNNVGQSAVMPISTEWEIVGGECFLLRRSTFKEVGGLNEGFGTAYGEDEEFSIRLQQAGYRNVWCADVIGHEDGKIRIDFPLEHVSNATTRTLISGSIHDQIERNHAKIEFIGQANERHLFYLSSLNRLERQVSDIIAANPDCCILIVDSDFQRLNTMHQQFPWFAGSKNIFVIPSVFGDSSIDGARRIADYFFRKEPFYITLV